jgi:hypothetical protein
MLTDEERKTIEMAATVASECESSGRTDDFAADLAAKLRAIAAPRPATVGELLATAPVGRSWSHRATTDGSTESSTARRKSIHAAPETGP